MELGPETSHNNNVVLGSSYCTGYVDSLGFYCPETEERAVSVFCCGSTAQKYCCTKADLRISDKDERFSNTLTLVLVSFLVIILAATTISVIFYSNLHTVLWRQKEKFLQKYRAKTSPGQLSPGQQIFPNTNSTQIIVEAAELGGVCLEEAERELAPVYIILPQPHHTPDLISETQVQVDSTFLSVDDDFFSTKF